MAGVQIEVSVQDAAAVRGGTAGSLLRWLQADDETRGVLRPATRAPGPEEMGLGSQILAGSVPVGTLTVLLRALQLWLRHQRHEVSVRVRRGDAKVELTMNTAADPETLAQALLAAVDASETWE